MSRIEKGPKRRAEREMGPVSAGYPLTRPRRASTFSPYKIELSAHSFGW
jgi:hypothetical protein